MTMISKFSQVKSKDHYENIFGIEMRACEKKPVKMCGKTTKYVLKIYTNRPSNRLEVHYQCTKNEIHDI